jgi:hypothetical protein
VFCTTDLIYVYTCDERSMWMYWELNPCRLPHSASICWQIYCRLYINVIKKCLKFSFCFHHEEIALFHILLVNLNFIQILADSLASENCIQVFGWSQKLSSSRGFEVIKYYFLSLCGNLILKLQENPIILHIEGKMKIVKHVVTSTAIPSPGAEIRTTRHSA